MPVRTSPTVEVGGGGVAIAAGLSWDVSGCHDCLIADTRRSKPLGDNHKACTGSSKVFSCVALLK
jgi:hypothetical protein